MSILKRGSRLRRHLPILVIPAITQRVQGILLELGGGVMLAATAFSLVIPGTEAAINQGYSKAIAALGIGLILRV